MRLPPVILSAKMYLTYSSHLYECSPLKQFLEIKKMSFEVLRKPRRKAGLLLIMLKNNSSFLHGCGLIPNLSVTLSAVKD